MSQVRKVLVALAFVTVSLAACNKDGSTTGAPAQEAMGLYAKGFNTLINDPKAMIKEYFSSIPEAGPDAKERLRLFPRQNFAARGIKEAREAFESAKSAAPESMAGLAPAADQAIAAIEKIETAFTAKKLLAAVEAASSPEELAGLEKAFGPIASANDALDKFVAGKGGKVNTTFKTYANHAGSFHATAIKLVRLVKDAKLDGAAIDRETESLVRNYNTLVSMANALYDVEAANALN